MATDAPTLQFLSSVLRCKFVKTNKNIKLGDKIFKFYQTVVGPFLFIFFI
jgi:hypothetical protein